MRAREARVLSRAGHHEGAYYLTGLAVECGLKACIARRTKRYEFPDKKVVLDSYSHDLPTLLRTAGLQEALDRDSTSRPGLVVNWAVVKDWSIQSRYTRKGKDESDSLYDAAVRSPDGVLKWIRQHW